MLYVIFTCIQIGPLTLHGGLLCSPKNAQHSFQLWCCPGELLSVAPWVIKKVPNLFALSERVLLGGHWEHGFFSLTAVGAYNVGSIEIDMDNVSRGHDLK